MDLLEPPAVGSARRDPIEAARAWLDRFERIALATVVATWGSSPVPVGGQLAVAPNERFEGSVSGGCVEAEVIGEAAAVIAGSPPKRLKFGVDDETAWRAGLPCGGEIEIFVEALTAARDKDYLDRLIEARRTRKPLVVKTRLRDGARTIFEQGSSCPTDIASAFTSGVSHMVEDGAAFVHVRRPTLQLVIVGATHVGQVLSDLAALLGWSVVVVDPRTAFATAERFAAAKRSTEWPEDSFEALTLDAYTAVVALTHMAEIDDEALRAAVRSPCFYVGALGSKRTQAKRVERLKAAGLNDAVLARIHGPVGLAIGAKGPEEIAVSIIAGIIKARREGTVSPA